MEKVIGNNLAVMEEGEVNHIDIIYHKKMNWNRDGYKDLFDENKILQIENAKLHQENEKLREVFCFARIEFEKRNREIGDLREELERARSTIKMLAEENAELKERLETAEGKVKLLNKLAFGKKSEKQEQKEEMIVEHKKPGAVIGHNGRGRKLPKELPVKEEIVDIPDEEKFCPNCGLPYKETGMEEVSSEICVEKVYYVKKIKRKVYKKTCTCPHQIVTAPVPGKLIPKGKFSLSFWVKVLLDKYKNHMPVERQVKDMQEYGLSVGSGTIFNGLKKIHQLYLEPLYQGLIKSVRESKHIHIDESGWKLFAVIDEKGNCNCFIWVFVCKDINVVLYVISPNRSASVPSKTLFDMDIEEAKLLETIPAGNKKRITVDKFSSYKSLERLGLVEITYCWAHQKRDFIVAETKYPQLQQWADTWIEKIGQLYHSNNERIKHDLETESFKIYDKQVREIIDQMNSEINQPYSHPQQMSLMESMKKHWQGLTVFVDNPDVDMDNNISERMLRSPVLGRKNYWGNYSLWAGQLSAAMFSIVQTCLSNSISPKEYLTWYLSECVKKGSAPLENEIDSFLPHNLTPDMRERLRVSKPGELIFHS
jgi:transposase